LTSTVSRELFDVQANDFSCDVEATVDFVFTVDAENAIERVQQGGRVHGCARHDGLADA
jgi:hypothetical protein